jgi:predicted transcriptional regulator
MENKLKKYLEEKGMSCREFGEKFPTPKSAQYIWSIVNGKKVIGINMLREIEKVTDGSVTPAQLRPDLAKTFDS